MTPPLVQRFLISFEQHKLLSVFALGTVVMSAAVYAILPQGEPPAPKYLARGILVFRQPPPAFTATGAQLQQQGRLTITEDMLRNDQILKPMAEKAKISIEKLNKRLTIKLPKAQPLTTGKGQPTIESEASSVILLELEDYQNGQRSQIILQGLMEGMVEYSRFVNTYQLRAKMESLEKRLGQVKAELSQAERQFYQFLSKEGTSLLAVQDGSLFNALTANQQQQRQIHLSLDQVEGQISSLIEQLGMTPEQAYISSALSADPIIASFRGQIAQIEQQLIIKSQELRPEHPVIVDLQRQKKLNESLLQQRVLEVLGKQGKGITSIEQVRQIINLDPARQNLANQLVSLRTQREGLVRQLTTAQKGEQELRQQYQTFPEKQLERTRLMQQLDNKQKLYQTILASLVDAQSADAETVSSLEIAQPAVAIPYKPPKIEPKNPIVIAVGGLVVGVLVGLGVIIVFAFLDTRLHTSQELRNILLERGVFLLGEVPSKTHRLSNGQMTPILLECDPQDSAFYERIRSNIRRLQSNIRVILVASVSDNEGKTITAYNLAIAYALAGKRTLLIEGDLSRLSACEILDIYLDPEDCAEPLKYYGNRNSVVRLVPQIENFYLVPSPGPQMRTPAILESNELSSLIKDARQRFDMVVIDTPSLDNSNDALLLQPFSEGIVLVGRPGVTQGNLFTSTLDQFSEAELPLLGVVVNGTGSNKLQEDEESSPGMNETTGSPDTESVFR